MGDVSTNLTHGFKTALAAVLAYAVTTLLALEFGYWAVISAVIVMQVYVADSVEMCFYRFSGTIIGATLGVVVLLVIPKTPIFSGIALFVAVGICSFLTRYKTRYRMAGITAVIVLMTGLYTQDVVIFGLYRVFEIGVGILCAFFVSILVFPKRKVDMLKAALLQQAKECAERCSILVDAFISKQQNVEESPVAKLVNDALGNYSLLEKADRHESLIYRKKFHEDLSLKVSVLSRSTGHLRNMVRALNALDDDDGYEIILSPEIRKLAEKSGNALVMLINNEPLTVATNELERIVADLDGKLIRLRKNGLIRRFDYKKMIQVFSFISSLFYFTDDILSGMKKVIKDH